MSNRYKVITIILILAFMLIFVCGCDNENDYEEVVRIHIRANSNSSYDQEVKYKVKDKIVEYITSIIGDIDDYYGMVKLLEDNLDKLKDIADETLKENNIDYLTLVELRCEEFPARVYDGVVLPVGVYQSLILELGEGKGDNWWCVAYPPLCFIAAEDSGEDYFRYKSKIQEIFNDR